MNMKTGIKDYAKTFSYLALGAVTVVGGAYIMSRIEEKQETENLIERMEQILENLTASDQSGKNK